MQIVETYNDIEIAKTQMNKQIAKGWKVHTCTATCFTAGYKVITPILVVYEKEI